jgi:hypothetical protein
MAILMQLPYQIFAGRSRSAREQPSRLPRDARAKAPGATQQTHFFQDIAVPIYATRVWPRKNVHGLPFAFTEMTGGDQGNPQESAHNEEQCLSPTTLSDEPTESSQ